jgi:lipopolysaccharide transport system ATP-binding protein
MSAQSVVSVNQVSKAYFLYRSLREKLLQTFISPFGKDYARKFWALKDVSFNVQRGETFGIIGKNGSGKSTLLQMIVGVLQPTDGHITTQGRITALLELAAGFSPEFTGRENIFQNGAILGISEKEMKNRLDTIIDFAQIGEYIDQPVKYYSSGMYVRLAFSIATSLDPDILVVDEALAVGDAGFVIKCMKHMQDLKKRGTTIILVTHDIQTVRSFCDKVLWLDEGKAKMLGSSIDVTSRYNEDVLSTPTILESHQGRVTHAQQSPQPTESANPRWGSGLMKIQSVLLNGIDGVEERNLEYGNPIQIEMLVKAWADLPTENISFGISIRNLKGLDIIVSHTHDEGHRINDIKNDESFIIRFWLNNILAPGEYSISAAVDERSEAMPQYIDVLENIIVFRVVSNKPIYSVVLPDVKQEITRC